MWFSIMIVFDCNLGTDPQWVVVFNLEMIYSVEVVADCLGTDPQRVVVSDPEIIHRVWFSIMDLICGL
jgi:hypothetical protein